MNTVLMDSGTAQALEQNLPPGNYRIEFETTAPLDIPTIKGQLAAGDVINVTNIAQHKKGSNWVTDIDYVRPQPKSGITQFELLGIVPLIVPLAVATLVGISIFKIGSITTDLVKVLVVGGGVFVLALAILGSGSVKAGSFELKKG